MTDLENSGLSSQASSLRDRSRQFDNEAGDSDRFRPLTEDCREIVWHKPKSDDELQRIAELRANRPDVEVRLWGLAAENLEFLQFFRGLKVLTIDVPGLQGLSGLRHVAETLTDLTVASTKAKLSLGPISGCPNLRVLYLGNQKKDFSSLYSLENLRWLGLRGHPITTLAPLRPFTHLEFLYLGLCNAIDLGKLGEFPDLESLHIFKMTNLIDISSISAIKHLKRLELAWLPHIQKAPNLSEQVHLEEIEIEKMKSLSDISGITAAPSLRYLGLWDCPSLRPTDFQPLTTHPTLQSIHFGVGSIRANETISAMFAPEKQRAIGYRYARDTVLRRPPDFLLPKITSTTLIDA